MGDISKAEKTNSPFAYALPQLKPCLAAKSKGDAFSFLLSFFEDGRKKERRKTWSGKTKQNKTKSLHGPVCANAAEESKDALTKQARNAEAWVLKHIRFMLFLPQTKNMFPFEMVESTAVLKSLGTSETNDPSQTVLTGSVLEPSESCDWCRITAAPSFSTSIIAQWKSCGAVGLSYNIVYITRWCKAPPAKLHCWIMIFTNTKRA